ncbi:MAG TPA: helix-turn-helix domain-containing protein [Clostridia bacterium]|nr:helix-turn-helix domain-containing protein [Clostridia bacterium]
MERKKIYLTTEKELRTYMHPLRQRILFTLERSKDGMTAKQLADALAIVPSSAGHHLSELEEAGLVELAYTEKVHGFTAKFYKATNVSVSLEKLPPEAASARRAVLQNHINENFGHWADAVEALDESGVARTADAADFSTGMLFLSRQDTLALHKMIRDFCDSHAQPVNGTAPYEFTLFYVRTGDEK